MRVCRATGVHVEDSWAEPVPVAELTDDVNPDVVLLAAVAGGDMAALRSLYQANAPWLAARLIRRCNDPDVVADVLQDTFVAVWRGAHQFRGEGEVAAWLWGIAVRRLVSRLRRTDRAVLVGWDALAGDDRHVVTELQVGSAEERVLLGVEHGDLAPALRSLSPQMRAVVQATVLDGLTTREAARLLGVRENTVKTRLHRAKAHMRRYLMEATP